MTQEPRRLATWTKWLKEDLWQDIHDGLVLRYWIFLGWTALLKAADPSTRVPPTFHGWVTRNYLDSLAFSIRRVTDDTADTRPISLVRLLDQVANDSHELTREWYVSRHDPWDLAEAEKRFRDLSPSGANHVDGGIALADCDLVKASVAKVKAHVDTHLAHLDANRVLISLTVGEVHKAVADIYRVYCKWFQAVTGEGVGPLLSLPWEHVFTKPWITRDQAVELDRTTTDEWRRLMTPPGISYGPAPSA